MHFPKSGNLRIITSLTLLSLLIGVAFIGYLPQLSTLHYSSATSSIVQSVSGQGGNCAAVSPCKFEVDFRSPVTAGNLLVVLVYDGFDGPLYVVDNLSSTFTLQARYYYNQLDIFTAPLTESGEDSVVVNDTSGYHATDDIFIQAFEVSGITDTSVQNASAINEVCMTSSCDLNTSSSVAFSPGAFLISFFYLPGGPSSFTPSSGFTSKTIESGLLYDEYSTSGVSSPTNFPASISNISPYPVFCTEIAIALEPVPTTTTVTVPTTTTETTTSSKTSTSLSTSTSTSTVTSTTAPPPPTTSTSISTTSTTTSTTTIFVYPTATHVNCFPSKERVHQITYCTAIVSSKSTLPTGNISFGWSEGKIGAISPPVNCVPVGGSNTKCSATIAFSFPKVGTVVATAAYSGDLTHLKSHAATLVHVAK
jgi:hypothetical protein